MLSKIYLVVLGFCLFALTSSAQVVYYSADQFKILGKAVSDGTYKRLPDSMADKLRKPVRLLGNNSAGLSIRFRSNTTSVSVRWESLGNHRMNHMADVGVKGVDLYTLEDGHWRFVNSGRPVDKKTEARIISNMQPKEREYMLNLPLYDGIVSLEIGVDSLSSIGMPRVELPICKDKIIMYGTSILQGACASRPGMAHTNIISRKMNREVINLGFSGNAFLDLEIASLMAQLDAGIFILDFVPNASPEQMEERMIPFYKILREKHPDTPVLFIEDPYFPTTFYDERISFEVKRKNATLNKIFQDMEAAGEQNIYLLHSDDLIGTDGEATVDGIHFSDLGMMRYADKVISVIYKLIDGK